MQHSPLMICHPFMIVFVGKHGNMPSSRGLSQLSQHFGSVGSAENKEREFKMRRSRAECGVVENISKTENDDND